MTGQALLQTDLQGYLELVARGKVRDLYAVDEKTLLFVATDRISAYDMVLKNGIPRKGQLLTLMTKHWFQILSQAIPKLQTHFISMDLPAVLSETSHLDMKNRSMQVRRLRVFPVEAIVRGYITGSAWKEYTTKGTVHGIQVASGLQESQKFPGGPLYTPSTKAEAGEHDENIHPDQAEKLVGSKHAGKIAALAIQLYKEASAYAEHRGIIIADTKFEFGLDEETDEVVLIDEVLTPDSSRFWSAENYQVGKAQNSFDKQVLRDWLVKAGLKGKQNVEMPEEVVTETVRQYVTAFEKLTGKQWDP